MQLYYIVPNYSCIVLKYSCIVLKHSWIVLLVYCFRASVCCPKLICRLCWSFDGQPVVECTDWPRRKNRSSLQGRMLWMWKPRLLRSRSDTAQLNEACNTTVCSCILLI